MAHFSLLHWWLPGSQVWRLWGGRGQNAFGPPQELGSKALSLSPPARSLYSPSLRRGAERTQNAESGGLGPSPASVSSRQTGVQEGTQSLSASAFSSAKWEWLGSKADRASVGVRSRISEPEASRARRWGQNSSCTTGHSVTCHCWPVGQLSWGDGVKSQVPDSHCDSRHLLRALYISGPVPRALCPRAG